MKRLFEDIERILPDKMVLQIKFFYHFHRFINWKSPKTFNEKLQWLKINDRNPLYTKLVDKIEVKKYVETKIGKEHIIPTLGVWNSFEEIDFDSLPDRFVLKTNHSSGNSGVVICKDKSKFNIQNAREKLTLSLKRNYYYYGREWPYKNVKPKIFAEQYMVDESGVELKDYKFFCFNGVVKFLKVDFNRETQHQANYLAPSWCLLPFGEIICPPDPKKELVKPVNFDIMIEFAKKLATNIPFARIDFYNVNGRSYFGEITFYPACGFGKFTPFEADGLIGKMLILPNRGGYIIDLQSVIIYIHSDSNGTDLPDYKFYCFNGVPKLCQLITNRTFDEKIDFYDMNWHRIKGLVGLSKNVGNSLLEYHKPDCFDEMIQFATILSQQIKFARIDFYNVNGKSYFGEITFYPASGFGEFKPDKWNNIIGDWIDLDFPFLIK